jgi:integrase
MEREMSKPVRHRGKWRIRWDDEYGERRSEVYPDHREAARMLCARKFEAEQRRRGLLPPVPKAHTFSELTQLWLTTRGAMKRSRKNDESVCRRLGMSFGKMKVTQIGIEDVDAYCDEHDDLSPKTLANHVTLLITMMNYAAALKDPWLVRVPKFKKPKISSLGRDYSFLRTDEEIDRFLRAAREEGEMVYALYSTAIRTGMRAGELAGLEWADVNFDQRLIVVQRSFEGLTKSGEVRVVPVLDVLLPELRAWRLRHPGRLVFANRDGGMLAPSGRIFQEVLHRVLERGEFSNRIGSNGKARRYITFHGLRHTFASHWMMKSGDLFKLQRILGHQSIAMTDRYAHLAPAAFEADYGRFGMARPLGEASVVAMVR